MGVKSRQKQARWLERRAAIRAALINAAGGEKLAVAYLAGVRQRWPVFFKQVEAELAGRASDGPAAADTPAIVFGKDAPKGGAA